MNATVYIARDGSVSLDRNTDSVEARTTYLGSNFVIENGQIVGPDGGGYTLTFSGGQLRRVAPDGRVVDLHVSRIEKF